MKSTSFIIALALLASCGSQTNETEKQTGKQEKNAKERVPVVCYRYANQGDTVTLTLAQVGELYTGALVYQLKEKDRNTGTVKGLMRGNILIADYTFNSEGTKSTRQVAFKKEGSTLVEGYGESVEENGATKFKDINNLNFGSAIVLQETPCEASDAVSK